MLELLPVFFEQLGSAVDADPVGQVNDQVALSQIRKSVDRLALCPPRDATHMTAPKQLTSGQNKGPVWDFETRLKLADNNRHTVTLDRFATRQQLRQSLFFAFIDRDDQHGLTAAVAVDVFAESFQVATKSFDTAERQLYELTEVAVVSQL